MCARGKETRHSTGRADALKTFAETQHTVMASSFAQLLAEKDDGLFGEDDEFGALAPAAKQRPAAHHGAAAPVQAGTVPPPALPAVVVGQEAGTTTAGHGHSQLDGHTMVSAATSLVAAPLYVLCATRRAPPGVVSRSLFFCASPPSLLPARVSAVCVCVCVPSPSCARAMQATRRRR